MESNAEDCITFCQSDFHQASFSAFEDMRKNAELCDLTIKVENYSFAAHRVVLAAGIPYFRSVFTGEEVPTGETEISIGDLDPGVLGSLIDFAYCGSVEISVENVHSLLLASQLLRVHQVTDACVEFLSNRFRFGNVLDVHKFARTHSNLNLIENCNRFIRENFEEFSETDDFLELPDLCIKEIITADELCVPSEKTVFEAVLNWVKHSSERHEMLPELLSEVRLVHLPTKYLTERTASEELINSSHPCRQLINEIKNYHLLKNSCAASLKTQPRKCTSIKEGVYAICRKGFSEYSICNYDLVQQAWHEASQVNTHVSYKDIICGVAAVNGKIYVFFRENVLIFNPRTCVSEMKQGSYDGISGSSIAVYGDIIYCFGSFDVILESTVRRLDTRQNRWLKEGIMKKPVCTAASASLGESIFVTGGYSRNAFLKSAEKYNPLTGEWRTIAPMLSARRRHGCATVREEIYVCGGSISGDDVRTAEVYSPHTNQWNYISPMKLKRNAFSFLSYNTKLYAFSGYALGAGYITGTEIYDPESNEWSAGLDVPNGYKQAISISASTD